MKTTETRDSIIQRRGYRQDIAGDKFSLYISSYPVAIEYLNQRIEDSSKTLAELCCGVGVTLEHIAGAFQHVIGVDIDEQVLADCKINLQSAGLVQKSTLVCGDINDEEILKQIKANLVIYDIPFWHPHEYENRGDLISKNPSLNSTVEKIRKFITKDIVIFCSPNFDYDMICEQLGPCEFQKVIINGKHDRNYIYLGDLKQEEGITELKL